MDNGASSYRRFLAGDNNALEDVVNMYKDGLALYLNSLTGNIRVAEELTEEVFVELVVTRPEYSGRSSFKTWLFSIARYIAYDYIKKSRRRLTIDIDELYELSDEEDIERSYLREEQRIQLRRAVNRLDRDYSQVLYLRFLEGFSNEETAQIMHKSKRQTENLIYRAKKALKTELEREGFEYEGF